MKLNLRFEQSVRGTANLITALFVLFGICNSANADSVFTEHFNSDVSDNAPIGKATGWHAYGLNNGTVADFTTSTPNSSFPTLSHGPAGAGSSGVGYLVMGSGNRVSNILVWLDASNFGNKIISEISFHTKNDSAESTEKIAVQCDGQWFVSAKTFHDAGGNAEWNLNTFDFESIAASWLKFDTNTLSPSATTTGTLPNQIIQALGFFGSIHPDAGKIRIDEIQVIGFPTNAAPTISSVIISPRSNVFDGMTIVLKASATGTPPLTYQWRKNGTRLPDDSRITGSSSSTLTLTNVVVNDSGDYEVLVSNSFGTDLSAASTIRVSRAIPAVVDLSQYHASDSIGVSQRDTNTLVINWSDKQGGRYRVHFNLTPGQVLLRSLETATNRNAPFSEIARALDPKYRVTFGSRYHKASWPYIFFDRVDANVPAPEEFLSSLNPKTVQVISDSPVRTRIVFSDLTIGPYSGDLTCCIYSGSPFVQFQASMRIDQPWVAFIHDALFYGNFETIAYKDINGSFQDVPASSLSALAPGESARLKVQHRTLMATVAGGTGTVAVMPPPHAAIFPTDQSDNYGFVQAGKNFIGTKMSYSADFRYRPWIDAPIGSTQRLDVFLVLSAQSPQNTLSEILNYTHGDSFKSIPGHYTMAEHFHPEFTDNHLHDRDSLTPFKQTMKAMGLQIVQPMEFHGPGHTFNNGSERLKELTAMFELFQANSDESFLLIPGEEYNNLLGGHWSYMFPKPVYFTGWHGQDNRAYRLTNVVAYGITYPLAYQIGDRDHMMRLLRDEGGIAWSSHPRVKGSRLTPDSFV
ncbi:MAG TPA: immunoglobulin domain-containing protein, partial [Verrucomicrobiae bacterium]